MQYEKLSAERWTLLTLYGRHLGYAAEGEEQLVKIAAEEDAAVAVGPWLKDLVEVGKQAGRYFGRSRRLRWVAIPPIKRIRRSSQSLRSSFLVECKQQCTI